MRRFIRKGGWVKLGRSYPNSPILVGIIILSYFRR